jgi:hypothetical protein
MIGIYLPRPYRVFRTKTFYNLHLYFFANTVLQVLLTIHSQLKGTVAPVWVWLYVAWSERAKIGEEPQKVFKVFHCLQLFINTNRNAAL